MKDLLNKKLYIKNNIHKIKNNNIINFIDLNKIKYTKNINGIFLDINILNENLIDKIIDIINCELNINENLNENINHKYIKPIQKNKEQLKIKKKDKENNNNNHNNIKMNNFNFKLYEKNIINYSKKYNLT